MVGVVVVALSERPSAASLVVGALIVGAIAIPVAAVLTNMGIKTRYLMRPSFGTDADLVLSAAGVTISQMSLNGTYPWTTYTRAVRFDDGVMLLKRGAIRWLPDSALVSGTVEDALQLLRAHLPITSFENQVLRQ